jgi:virulence-associated protein VapD
MTLDEAITHCEETATEKEAMAEFYKAFDMDPNMVKKSITECQGCAKEHRQLAEWLKELRWYWEQDLVSRETAIGTVENIYNTCGGFCDIDYIYEKIRDIPRVRYELGLMVDE